MGLEPDAELAIAAARWSLVVRARSAACALPLACVVETLRPLPISAVRDAPGFVLGLSIIRGVATPVVDLGALLTLGAATAVKRLVVVRVGQRAVALAVDAVDGVRDLRHAALGEMPPLLTQAADGVLERVGSLDNELLLVIQTGRLLPAHLSHVEWAR